jgi:hypothetical protein
MRNKLELIFLSAILVLLASCYGSDMEPEDVPPDEPAVFEIDGQSFSFTYAGETIIEGTIENDDDTFRMNKIADTKDNVVQQVISFTSTDKTPLLIKCTIKAGNQSFPCEADRPAGMKNIIRHVAGQSRSLRNHAVYDRNGDWLFSVDYPAETVITPVSSDKHHNKYELTTTGGQVGLRFRPAYYREHRGLSYFKPWTYKVWDRSVAGWCSWFAFFKDITEKDVKETADSLSESLMPFGLEYLQVDDGYQQEPSGLPKTWNKPNEKFPSGLESLADYIKSKGLKPGIWTYTSFNQKKYAEGHPRYFVRDKEGEAAYGNWVGYVLDGSNPRTLKKIIRPIYDEFIDMGWEYFKVDGLRHLRYEGYNSYADYFTKKGIDRVEAYRNLAGAIRDEIGTDSFMLGCWGFRPELIGIIDGCRIGGDGYGYACLTQFNSFNNVVWRNDPDHIVLDGPEAYRSCMVTSLTGSLYMLADKPAVYRTDIIEPARRTLPVLFTVPGQVYDVDPSRSIELDRIDSELSGDSHRVMDGSLESPYNLFMLEISKPYEDWVLLGRTEEREKKINFSDLGLDEKKEYLVFEYWSRDLMGVFQSGFEPGQIDPSYNCQLFCIREKQGHPQLVATSRHISCGGYETENLAWQDGVLKGTSNLIANDPFSIYIMETPGYEYLGSEFKGAELISSGVEGGMRVFLLKSGQAGALEWSVEYREAGASPDPAVKGTAL